MNSGRSEYEVVWNDLVIQMRKRCAEAMFGIDGNARSRSALTVSEAEMREMTTCEDFPNGLEFSSGDYTSRRLLYEMRDKMVEDLGLYFIGEPRVGIRWTCYHPKGIAWRVKEWFQVTHPKVRELAAWSPLAATRISDKSLQKKLQRVGELYREIESREMELYNEIRGILDTVPGARVLDDDIEEAA